jgi:hypothetical protein
MDYLRQAIESVLALGPTAMLAVAVCLLGLYRPKAFLLLFMLVYALRTSGLFEDYLVTFAGSFRFVPEDLFLAVAVLACVTSAKSWRMRGVSRNAAIGLAVIVGLGAISWILELGVQQGVNNWRAYSLAVAMLIYPTVLVPEWTSRDLLLVIVVPASVATILALYKLITTGIGSVDLVDRTGAYSGNRPSSAGLLLLVAMWVLLTSRTGPPALRYSVGAFFGLMVVLLQYRSVWIAGIASAIAWVVAPRAARGTVNAVTRGLVTGGAAIAIVLLIQSNPGLNSSAHATNTLDWREERWTDSLSIPRSVLDWLVGGAFGTTPPTQIRLTQVSSHNTYIDAIEFVGVIGLACVVVLLICAASVRFDRPGNALGVCIVCAFAAFGMFYVLLPWSWMLVGILIVGKAEKTPLINLSDHGNDAELPRAGPASLKPI